jgi:hypothetical protein
MFKGMRTEAVYVTEEYMAPEIKDLKDLKWTGGLLNW